MIPEYDFTGGERGKYAEAMRHDYTVIVHRSDGKTQVRTIKNVRSVTS